MNITQKISAEIREYTDSTIELSKGIRFSQYKLVNSIMFASNKRFKNGSIDAQGQYKYYIDICGPRIDSEIKNIDFDTSNINIVSEMPKDAGAMLILNLFNKEWMRDNGQAGEINDAIEEGSGWGNVVWKKIKGGYEKVDLKDFYVINQTAETLKDTPVIERHIMTQAQLRAKKDWMNVEEVIRDCGEKNISSEPDTTGDEKETPYYPVYERNGEVSEKDLFEAQGKEGGDEDKYILAKIILTGIKSTNEKAIEHILFAEEISKMPYKEYHRGKYNGRWFREGIYELLFDIQEEANEIGNLIIRGVRWSSKVIFKFKDNIFINNILTDLANGDALKGDLEQVEVRNQGVDQALAEWKRLMDQADKLTNSYEVVSGETMPSGTPFRLAGMLNQNANKLFDFIREKLAIALGEVYNDWILPELMKNLKSKDVIRLTGSGEKMEEYYKMVVSGWYNRNLISIPPHTQEQAELIKQKKIDELKKNKQQFLKMKKDWFKDVKARAMVVITGEQLNINERIETLSNLIKFETDPIRISILLDRIYSLKGIEGLPSPQEKPQVAQQQVKQ